MMLRSTVRFRSALLPPLLPKMPVALSFAGAVAFGVFFAASAFAQAPAAPVVPPAKPAAPVLGKAPAAGVPAKAPAAGVLAKAPAAGVPAAAKPAASAKPSGKFDNTLNPATGLPNWHPPVGGPEPGANAQPPMRPGHDQRNARQLIEQLKRNPGSVTPELGSAPVLAFPKDSPFAKDSHGNCVGQGPDDAPKNVNLFHGWLGVDNVKAIAAPPRLSPSDTGWFAVRFGGSAWWKWRLTPYPWRYENHDDECDPRNTPIPLLANLINFALLLFLLQRFGGKPLAAALEKRRATIMLAIERAQEIKDSATKRVAEYQSELDHLDEKLTSLRQHYAEEGKLEEVQLREELSQARDRMLADVGFRIDQEGKTTRDRLSRDALEGALGAAQTLIGETLNDDDHKRLCEEFLDQLGGALTKSPSDGGVTGAAS